MTAPIRFDPEELTPPEAAGRQPDCVLEVARIEVATGEFTLRLGGLALRRGRRAIIVGPNGAGKTTLIEALLGLRQAVHLNGLMFGRPLADWSGDRGLRQRVGVQLQQGLYPGHLTAAELTALHRAMFGRADAKVGAALGLSELGQRSYRNLSHGQRQRLNLYMALAHRPELAILDEPLTGLDRSYAEALATVLRDSGPDAMLIVGHSAAELALADELIWLQSGELRFCGPIGIAQARYCGGHRADLAFADADGLERHAAEIEALPIVRRVERSGPHALRIFGETGLKDHARSWAQLPGIEAFAFTAIGADELLRFCSNGGAHA
jgi:ABC-2 type transport system ATP-binding protein